MPFMSLIGGTISRQWNKLAAWRAHNAALYSMMTPAEKKLYKATSIWAGANGALIVPRSSELNRRLVEHKGRMTHSGMQTI